MHTTRGKIKYTADSFNAVEETEIGKSKFINFAANTFYCL